SLTISWRLATYCFSRLSSSLKASLRALSGPRTYSSPARHDTTRHTTHDTTRHTHEKFEERTGLARRGAGLLRTELLELFACEVAAGDGLDFDDLPQPVLHLDELGQVLHHF